MPKAWAAPSGVIEATVDPATGLVLAPGCQPQGGAARREVFLAGNAPREVCPWSGEPVFSVPSPEPLDEELVADLPPEVTEDPLSGASAKGVSQEPASPALREATSKPPEPTPAPSAEPAASPPKEPPPGSAPTPSPSATPAPAATETPAPTPPPAATPTPVVTPTPPALP